MLKRIPAAPDELTAEVLRQYTTLMRGLLDLTDNRMGGEVVHPDRVRVLDGPDPYLVVAADKGTATFSDTANDDQRGVRFLAGRCLRFRRFPGLRPQGARHHRPRRLGVGEASLPGARRRRDGPTVHRGRASGTCRETCSATACCCRRTSSWLPPSTTARLPRSGPRSSRLLRGAAPALHHAAVVMERLRPVEDVAGRSRLRSSVETGRDRPQVREVLGIPGDVNDDMTPDELIRHILHGPRGPALERVGSAPT